MKTGRVAAWMQALRRMMWQSGLQKMKPWDGHAIALHDYRAVYYLVPKVACSSLTAVCVDLLGFELPDNSWKPGVFRSAKHDGLIDAVKRDAAKMDVVEANRLDGYWRFAFVRNPYDRLVSCYSEKIRDDGPAELFRDGVHRGLLKYGTFKRGMSFVEFARVVAEIPDAEADSHFRSQTSFITDASGELVVDFLGKFENLGEDVARVAEHLSATVELPHLLKSKHSGFVDYYDEATREVVWNRYRNDFDLMGYDVDLPQPGAQA